MSKIIGLTGGIATGKSTVSRYLAEKGISIIDADIAARKVVEPQTEGLAQIVDAFSHDVLHADGSLNRKQLGKIVFSDEAKRLQLNALLHPLIRQWIRDETARLTSEQQPIIVLDIPLLYEAGYRKHCHQVVVVYTSKETQLKRLMERDGLNETEAKDRIDSQMSIEDKKELADIVIDNEGSLRETYEQVEQWLATLKEPGKTR